MCLALFAGINLRSIIFWKSLKILNPTSFWKIQLNTAQFFSVANWANFQTKNSRIFYSYTLLEKQKLGWNWKKNSPFSVGRIASHCSNLPTKSLVFKWLSYFKAFQKWTKSGQITHELDHRVRNNIL